MVDFTGGTWRSLIDGQEVSAIPDTENLQIRFAADEGVISNGTQAVDGDEVDTWEEISGQTSDLDGFGSPTFNESGQNDLPIIECRSGDRLEHTESVNIGSGPWEVWLAFSLSSSSGTQLFFDGEDDAGNRASNIRTDSGSWAFFNGSQVSGGSVDTNAHILRGVFDGTNSTFEIDESEIASGDAGGRAWDQSVSVADAVGGGNPTDIDIFEILVYKNRDNDRSSDIYAHLDRWGIL